MGEPEHNDPAPCGARQEERRRKRTWSPAPLGGEPWALNQVLERFYTSQVTEPLLYHSRQLAEMLAADDAALQAEPMMAEMVGGEVMVLDEAGRLRALPGASRQGPPAGAVTEVLADRTYTRQWTAPEGSRFIVTGVPVPGGRGGVLRAPQAP